jgi:hypothetical protein
VRPDDTATGNAVRHRQRRRFAAQLAPVALAQSIGLAVALMWVAAGHNPLSRK